MAIKSALEKYAIIKPYLDDVSSIVSISKNNGISLRTLNRWINGYRNNGLDGIVPKNNLPRKKKIDEEVKQLIQGLWLKGECKSIASLHRQLKNYCEIKKINLPSYSVTRDIVKQIPKPLKYLASEGTKKYQEKYDIIYIREAERSNHIWQADHTMLDIIITGPKGKLIRPWLTVIQDDFSRGVPGYYLSISAPSSQNTALALKQAIWRKSESNWIIFGIPEILYTDHGCDFTSSHIEEACAALKIQLIYSTVGKPQGRGKIERLFLTINQKVLCDLKGYTKTKKKNKNQKTMTFEELDLRLKHFFLNEYNNVEHSVTKEIPNEKWRSESFIPNITSSLEELDILLLMANKPRLVQRDGISFMGFRYMNITLCGYVGESVIIKYDPRDLAEIRVYHNNKYICTAVSQDLESHQISAQDIIKARNKKRKELNKLIKSKTSIIDSITKPRNTIDNSISIEIKESACTEKTKIKLKKYENE